MGITAGDSTLAAVTVDLRFPVALHSSRTIIRHSAAEITAPSPPPFQDTRLQRQVLEALSRLQSWANNPWRRLSLLLIVLLAFFWIGSTVGAITGAANENDLVAALLCVLALEIAARSRRRLLRQRGDRLPLQLLDMSRLGLLYGLLLEGFKLL
ncbi:MAG: DUF565 domain-containing protein [Synechococcaceae cyanobacterium]|nr:DUF565 domain-containing protein [Synechococcaceae cyanobacterium]